MSDMSPSSCLRNLGTDCLLPIRWRHSSASFEFFTAVVLVAINADCVVWATSCAALLDALLTSAGHQFAQAGAAFLRHTLRCCHAGAGTCRRRQCLHATLHHTRGEVRLPTILAHASITLKLNRTTETRLLGQGHGHEHGDGDQPSRRERPARAARAASPQLASAHHLACQLWLP